MSNRFLCAMVMGSVLLLSGACDGVSLDGERAEDNNYLYGEPCGSGVISDYNSMGSSCRNMQTRDDARNCRIRASAMLYDYPGLYCKAERQSSGRDVYITEADVQEVVNRVDDFLNGSGAASASMVFAMEADYLVK